jgi:hypothetical protein
MSDEEQKGDAFIEAIEACNGREEEEESSNNINSEAPEANSHDLDEDT